MSPILIGAIGFVCLIALAAARMPIGLALALVGLVGTWILQGSDTAIFVLGSAPVDALSNFTLSVLPLFFLMGILMVRSGLAESLYRSAYTLVGHYRGGLAMSTIVACGGFGSVCGSSLATAATMSKIAVPEMIRYGYSRSLAMGSVASGGTLGILIPPSLPMIIYGVLTETSIGQLFAAGLVPGLIAMGFYLATTVLLMKWKPEWGPAGEKSDWPTRFASLRKTWGVLVVFALVIGGIFAGLFSPTEAGAVGALGALAIGLVQRRINFRDFVGILIEVGQITAMLMFILVGVTMFDFFVSATRFPEMFVEFVNDLNMSRWAVLWGIVAFLVLLGTVLEVIAIIFITTPFLFPLILGLGFDPVWFGIVMVMVVEIGLITPPFGMNVFVVAKSIPGASAWEAFRGVMPYVGADILRVSLLIALPGLTLWLPGLLFD